MEDMKTIFVFGMFRNTYACSIQSVSVRCKFIYATMSEKFCLKWNDFESNVSNSFSLLRNEDYLHDVTIVSDDNEQISAHKLVLSACSEYFKNIFKKNKHSHPYAWKV